MAENPHIDCDNPEHWCSVAWEEGREIGQLEKKQIFDAGWEAGEHRAALKWRPIPDEAPGDGWYLARRSDLTGIVALHIDGREYTDAHGVYDTTWAGLRNEFDRIAGPITPPEDKDG